MDNKKILTLSLAGTAVGVALWVLLKTKSGQGITRDIVGSIGTKINNGIDDFSGHFGEMINYLKTKANNSIPV